MAIIKHINGVPAFSTRNEAVIWGRRELNLNGYHIHYHNGNKTYMAGLNHDKVVEAQYEKYLKTRRQQTNQENTPPPTTSFNNEEGGNGGTNGGGY